MKILVALLVIANVIFFMWEYKNGGLFRMTEKAAVQPANDQEKIMLTSELKNDSSRLAPQTETMAAKLLADDSLLLGRKTSVFIPVLPKEEAPQEHTTTQNQPSGLMHDEAASKNDAVQAAPNDSKDKAGYCYEVGPFNHQQDYQRWISSLNGNPKSLKLVSKEQQVVSHYIVYYPAPPTLKEAEANVQMLKKHGIKDLFIRRNKEDLGEISLGVFSREERAIILKNQFLAKGINAKVKSQYKTKPQQFALINSADKLTEQWENLQIIQPRLTVKELSAADCE